MTSPVRLSNLLNIRQEMCALLRLFFRLLVATQLAVLPDFLEYILGNFPWSFRWWFSGLICTKHEAADFNSPELYSKLMLLPYCYNIA